MRGVILALLLGGCLQAHQISEMTLDLKVRGDRITGTLRADAAYMLPEFRGDEEEAKDLAWLRGLGPTGWQRIEQESERYLRDCLSWHADGSPLEWSMVIPDFQDVRPRFLTRGQAEELPMVDIGLHARLPAAATALEIAWQEPFGVALIVVTGGGDEVESIPLVGGERAVVARRGALQEDFRPAEASAGSWIHLGFVHILPRGLDHILFVLGLFLLVPKWKPLLLQTLTFTVAHSMSLAAAVLGWVKFPENPVEILIAASIAWVGIENLWVKDLGKSRLLLVGMFGLVHGLGFAGVLAEFLPASRPEKLPAALLGFNVGVELGQIAVLVIAFAACGWLGKREFRRVKIAGSIVIALAGLAMVVERLVGVKVLPFL